MTNEDERQEMELEEDLYQMIVEHLGTTDQKTIEKWIETTLQEYIKENGTE
jgi:tRNA(Ser,Leu) C12 N-acetylase TAN1